MFACFNQPHSTGDVQQKSYRPVFFFCYKKNRAWFIFEERAAWLHRRGVQHKFVVACKICFLVV